MLRTVAELRNVIVFTIGGVRYALELRWVREVVSLGFVTGVPTAPAALSGVCNLHGTILPVLDVAASADVRQIGRGRVQTGHRYAVALASHHRIYD